VNAADEPVPEKTAILVWDLPTRILHWALAGTSGGALAIGLTVEKEHPLFRWHVILGVMAGFFVVLRLIWGVIGTKYARFTHFPLRPTMLGRYCRHLFRRDWRDFPGLNPAAAWVSTGVLVAVGLLVLTGPGFGGKRPGEAHKLPAYALLGLIALHAVELTCCSIAYRENRFATMITGRRRGKPEDAIASAMPLRAIALVVGSSLWIGALLGGYDDKAGTLRIPLTGISLHLEAEGSERDFLGRLRRRHD